MAYIPSVVDQFDSVKVHEMMNSQLMLHHHLMQAAKTFTLSESWYDIRESTIWFWHY